MDIHGKMQALIEEKAPEFMPFLKFIESTQDTPVASDGHMVSYDDQDLLTVIIAVYLYAQHRKEQHVGGNL